MLVIGFGGFIFLRTVDVYPINKERQNNSAYNGGEAKKVNTRIQQLDSQKRLKDKSVSWKEFDIQMALADLNSLPYGKKYQKILREIATYYGENDPESGKLWLLSLDNSPENLRAFLFFGSSWASSVKGISSLDFYHEINHESFRDEFLKGSIPWLSLEAGNEVINFLLINRNEIRGLDAHLSRTANTMAASDPQRCFQTIHDLGVSETTRAEMYKGFFGRLTSQENWAGAMIPYLDQLSMGEDEDRLQAVLVDVVSAAPKSEFEEVTEILNAVPASAAKDQAAMAFSYSLINNDAPESAILWVNTITNSEIRDKVTTRIFRKIQDFDGDLANRLLEEINTSEEVKHRLRSGGGKD